MQKLDESDAMIFGDAELAVDFTVGIEVIKLNAQEQLMNMNLKDVFISTRERLQKDIQLFFFKDRPSTAILTECTCLVVKPHAVDNLGSILDMVLDDGFEVSALQLFNLQLG